MLDFELKQSVTRREVDVVTLARVPTAHYQSTGIGIRLNLVDQPRDLIDAVAFWVVTAERAPEISVDRAKVTSFASEAARVFIVSPFLPNIHTARAQVRFVRIA